VARSPVLSLRFRLDSVLSLLLLLWRIVDAPALRVLEQLRSALPGYRRCVSARTEDPTAFPPPVSLPADFDLPSQPGSLYFEMTEGCTLPSSTPKYSITSPRTNAHLQRSCADSSVRNPDRLSPLFPSPYNPFLASWSRWTWPGRQASSAVRCSL